MKGFFFKDLAIIDIRKTNTQKGILNYINMVFRKNDLFLKILSYFIIMVLLVNNMSPKIDFVP